jgi:hypothetical protein
MTAPTRSFMRTKFDVPNEVRESPHAAFTLRLCRRTIDYRDVQFAES